MTAEMIMVSTWVTDSLFVWILLELLELGLYFYLILGILPGIKNMGKIDKIILRTVFLAMAVLIGIKYRIGTTFSHLSFSYNLLVLILETGAAVRENFLLTAGIAVTYTSSILLLRYILLFVMCLAAYGTESPLSRLAFAGGHGNTAFAVTHLGVLLLVFLILYRIRNSGISRQIRAYRNLLLLVGIVLSALALEYQNLLEYGFQYLPVGIPAVNSILRDSLLSLLTSVALGAAAGVLFLKNRSIRTENNLLLMKEEMEKQKYEEIRSAVEKNREMVHDTKNHYLVICEYIQNEKYDCLKNYVADIQKNFERTDSRVYTGNYILDLILGQKKTLAREKGIPFELQAMPLSSLPFSEREICSLFGNLLDNAVEACERVMEHRKRGEKKTDGHTANKQEAPKIRVRIQQRNQLLFVEIINSTDGLPFRKEREFLTGKTDPSLHGYGLKSAERIVEEHDGVIVYDADREYFKVTVTFFDVE